MKLRIHDNSIRFRLSRSEVEKLAAEGRVESFVQFTPAPNDRLTYVIETPPSCENVGAQHSSNEICVQVPRSLAQVWATNGQVGIEHLQQIGPDAGLQILIEKDFHCLHRESPTPEDVTDLYPNPNEAADP